MEEGGGGGGYRNVEKICLSPKATYRLMWGLDSEPLITPYYSAIDTASINN